jgi:predicted DsbA family dithiol-disulfide isomerase
VLESDAYEKEVRADEAEAAELGVGGVPFFVVNRRYAVSGAQPPEVLLQVLDRAWTDRRPLAAAETEPAADACEGDACAI